MLIKRIRDSAYLLLAVGLLASPPTWASFSLAEGELPKPDRQIHVRLGVAFEQPFDWANYSEKDTLLKEAEAQSTAVKAFWYEREATLGREAFLEQVQKNKIALSLGAWGKGEVTDVDGTLVVRVVHFKTELSFYFLEKSEVNPNSPHLRQIIARQHIDAGQKRPDGSKPGRDTIVAWTKDHRVLHHHYYPRHPPFTKEWIRDYWVASWRTPTSQEYVFGSFCAALQVGASACVAAIRYHNEPSSGFDTAGMVMSALWGFGIGAYNGLYRNIIYRGSERSKFGKMWTQSMLYAWSIYIYSDGLWSVINFTAAPFWQLNANAVINSWLHNQGRRAWYLFPEVRSFHRQSVGNLKIGMFDTGIKKASWEQQMFYLIPYSIKLAGLVGVGTVAQFALTDDFTYKLDGGTLVLLGSVPFAQAGALWYAYAQGFPNAKEYKAEFLGYWKRLATLPFRLPANLFKWLIRSGFQTAKAGVGCAAMLVGKITP